MSEKMAANGIRTHTFFFGDIIRADKNVRRSVFSFQLRKCLIMWS